MKTQNTTLSPSQEDYLETILELETVNRVARVKDIADKLNVRMPSVTHAMKSLRDKQLISYEKNSYIQLTQQGKRYASEILKKHTALEDFLCKVLLLNKEKARKTACQLEHSIDTETERKLRNLTDYIQDTVNRDESENWEKTINKGL